MLYTHNKHGLYVSCGRGYLDDYFNDLWIFDFSDDQWRKMDQTFISIMPEPRYATVGGIYPSYEYSSDDKNNLYLAMGRSQYTMYNNMYAFTFTDLRAVSGIWDLSKLLPIIKIDLKFEKTETETEMYLIWVV